MEGHRVYASQLTKVQLYRAANRAVAGPGAAFSPDVTVAEAYLNNPGFGGADLYRFEVLVDEDTVLPLWAERRPLWLLAEALGHSDPGRTEERWRDRGLCRVYDVLENTDVGAELAGRGYTWITYDDDFPNREPLAAETWVKLAPGRLVGKVLWGRPALGLKAKLI